MFQFFIGLLVGDYAWRVTHGVATRTSQRYLVAGAIVGLYALTTGIAAYVDG